MNVILAGTVGSHAYGLNREGSDVDKAGVYVAPTLEVAGLDWNPSKETKHGTSDTEDYTYHEVGKAFRLMLSCNPTVMELLYLESYDRINGYGSEMVTWRRAFLSERRVRDAYGGYARAQAVKLAKTEDGFPRGAKQGRHLVRLLRQGTELLTTGNLTLRVPDPETYWAFDHYTRDEMLAVYDRENAAFDAAPSVLPAEPDRTQVTAILRGVRKFNL